MSDRLQTQRGEMIRVALQHLLEQDRFEANFVQDAERELDALLAVLDQAERDRDEQTSRKTEWFGEAGRRGEAAGVYLDRALAAEARLARVPALLEALRNWLEDVDEAERDDLRLHDLQQRIGAMFLGYGGGHNHEDDLRAALEAWENE